MSNGSFTTRLDRTLTSECVSDGHPDKLCDQISDAVLDACLEADAGSRVAVETAAKGHDVFVLGEVTSNAALDLERIVAGVLRDVGHGDGRWGLDLASVRVHPHLSRQAGEIANAVGQRELGAGDQGLMTGYATDETPELMPLAFVLARNLLLRQRELRRTTAGSVLGPDAKSQVTVRYEDGRPAGVDCVVLSSQHEAGVGHAALESLIRDEVIARVLPAELVHGDTVILVNPSGSFVEGGPVADAGLTGRKIIADTYGGAARHGGGAFSGKDATKVDRSGAYAARQLAREIVARGWARRAEVQVAYAIGRAEPVALDVETFGTATIPEREVMAAAYGVVRDGFRPAAAISRLGLDRPIFRATAAFGHFGRPEAAFPWEARLSLDGEAAIA